MTRDPGPEEFFEVFREVQSTKKKRQEAAQAADQPLEPPAEDDDTVEQAPPPPEPEAPRGPPSAGAALLTRTVEVSVPVAAAVVVGALLLAAATYMLGKQQGWRAHVEAVNQAAVRPTGQPGSAGGSGRAVVSDEPELINDRVFTLVTYRGSAQHRKLAQLEADYLNEHPRFRALGLRAYVYRDRGDRYRLCVRGLRAKSEAERAAARATIRKLRSRQNELAYKDADFYAP
ncbi:MAG: hypothetical protein ACODAJ_08885 [Planctomycetota bacterium]